MLQVVSPQGCSQILYQAPASSIRLGASTPPAFLRNRTTIESREFRSLPPVAVRHFLFFVLKEHEEQGSPRSESVEFLVRFRKKPLPNYPWILSRHLNSGSFWICTDVIGYLYDTTAVPFSDLRKLRIVLFQSQCRAMYVPC